MIEPRSSRFVGISHLGSRLRPLEGAGARLPAVEPVARILAAPSMARGPALPPVLRPATDDNMTGQAKRAYRRQRNLADPGLIAARIDIEA